MKRLHVGQIVKIENPIDVACRYWHDDFGGKGKTSDRGCIQWEQEAGAPSMWLDAEQLVRAK